MHWYAMLCDVKREINNTTFMLQDGPRAEPASPAAPPAKIKLEIVSRPAHPPRSSKAKKAGSDKAHPISLE
jgi:hypothetical protein